MVFKKRSLNCVNITSKGIKNIDGKNIFFTFLNLEQGGAKISRPEYLDPNPLILVVLQIDIYVVQIKIFKLT